MTKLTQQQAIVLTGFTGFMCVNSFSDFHADVEKRLGHPVWTHQFPGLREALNNVYRADFLAMLPEPSEAGQRDPWHDAVLDQCAIACLDGDFTDPRATLDRLILWHVQMALDPRISEAAAGLVLAAKVEALEWAATQCDDEAEKASKGNGDFDCGRESAAEACAAEIRAGKGYTS